MNTRELRRENKKNAKAILKKHYGLLFAVCLIAAVLGTDFMGSLAFLSLRNELKNEDALEENVITKYGYDGIVDAILDGTLQQYKEKAKEKEEKSSTEGTSIGPVKFEREQGILAAVVNKAGSSTLILSIVAACIKITGSTSFGSILFILLSLLAILAFNIFVVNVYKAVMCRIFLESRIYGRIPKARFLYPLKTKKWIRMSGVLFKKMLYQLLWSLTIIGGIIKHYSYCMVPYIVAENPNVKGSEALTLSRRMMNGHKWELFVADLSFILWFLLNIVTFGLLRVFFLNQYYTAVYAEYFAKFRKKGIEDKLEGYELFADKYLFEKADAETIDKAYADIIELKNEAPDPDAGKYKINKIARFFANIFGIVLYYGPKEKQYRIEQKKSYRIKSYEQALEGNTYPVRLSPIPEKEKLSDLESLDYNRCYSILSLIIVFFFMCFIGWLWEGCIHIVKDGMFINRGVMHGPWIPIYGSGCTMILILLKKFRSRPWLEFLMAIVLCGIAEYATSYYLQIHYNGQKWWDYTGYYLNINGRVCAEGLLVFGLGGAIFVYFVAPLVDNVVRKINTKLLLVICIILIASFTVDARISAKHPNQGKGITDYGTSAHYVVPEEEYPLQNPEYIAAAEKIIMKM